MKDTGAIIDDAWVAACAAFRDAEWSETPPPAVLRFAEEYKQRMETADRLVIQSLAEDRFAAERLLTSLGVPKSTSRVGLTLTERIRLLAEMRTRHTESHTVLPNEGES